MTATDHIPPEAVEAAARALQGDVEYVVHKRDGTPLTVARVRLTHREAVEVARAAMSASLPVIREGIAAEVLAPIQVLIDGPLTVDAHLRSTNGYLFVSVNALRATLSTAKEATNDE